MKKLLAIILSVTMILGCAVLCTSAKFGDTVTESDEVIEIDDNGTTTILFASQMTAVDDSDDTIVDGAALAVAADPYGYPYFDNVRKDDYFVFKANVNTAGTYKMALNFGWRSGIMTGDFTVIVDGGTPVSVVNEVEGIDWRVWTLSTELFVELDKGEHEIKVVIDGYAINLSAFCIAPENMTIEPVYPVVLSKSPLIEGGETLQCDITGGTYDYQFVANASFDAFSFMFSTSGYNMESTCIISLYAFDTDLEKTLEGEAIVTLEKNNISNHSLVEVDVGKKVSPGEYVAHIDATMGDTDHMVNVYTYIGFENDPTGLSYVDGEYWDDQIPIFIVNFTEAVENEEYFGQCVYVEHPDDVPGDDEGGDDTTVSEVDGTVAPDVDGTAAPDVDGTSAPEIDGTAANTAAGTGAVGTAAETAAAGTGAADTAAAPAEGCKAVVGSIPAIALVAVASAAAVVLKKKED